MPMTFYFAEEPTSETSLVLDWFRKLENPPREAPSNFGLMLHFHAFGELKTTPDGLIDAGASPVATIFLPTKQRAALRTLGEVHLLPGNMKKVSPGLAKVGRAFREWLFSHPVVWDHAPNTQHEMAYYLEGSAKNWGPIYALPSGLEALFQGQYFVSRHDNDAVLDRVCKTLRLRGVECGT